MNAKSEALTLKYVSFLLRFKKFPFKRYESSFEVDTLSQLEVYIMI